MTAFAAVATNLLEIQDLQTHFFTPRGVARVLDGLNLRLEAGSIVGLVGETGSGKSVTGFSILRLVRNPGRIVGGEIRFDGRNLLALPEGEMVALRGRSIAMIFQNPRSALNPLQSVGRFLEQVLAYRVGISKKDLRAEAIKLLRAVHMPDPERRLEGFPHQISGGMAQRVMIAAAIASRPKLLIADEPTTGLDVTVQAQIVRLLRELRDQTGSAQLLITHDLGLASEVCDSIAVMYAGEIVEFAPTRELFTNPQHPYTQGLLASRPKLGQTGTIPVIAGNVPNLIDPPSGCRFHPRCPHALERCRHQRPLPTVLSAKHSASCFLLDAAAAPVQVEGRHA